MRAGANDVQREVADRLKDVSWYMALSAEDRSFLGVVVGKAIRGFAGWLESDEPSPVEHFVFIDVPPRMAAVISLDQTVELVHLLTSVGEEAAPVLGGPDHDDWTRHEIMRFSRDVALALASIYARAAEWRGSVDARQEAHLFSLLLSGAPEAELLAGGAALGWDHALGATAVVGTLEAEQEKSPQIISLQLRREGLQALVGVHGDRLILLVAQYDCCRQAADMLRSLCTGPIIIGSQAATLRDGVRSIAVALSGSDAASMLPDGPAVIEAADLLVERALLADESARLTLINDVFTPLQGAGDYIVETLWAYLDSGASLEKTARRLHVHPNTVRYRLRRVEKESGYLAKAPRDGLILRTALALGRRQATLQAGEVAK